MILDMSVIRRKGDDILSTIIFELKMKGLRIDRREAGSMLPAAGLVFINREAGCYGIHSHEMINVMECTGVLFNVISFSMIPLLQNLKVHDINMINTYVKDRLSA